MGTGLQHKHSFSIEDAPAPLLPVADTAMRDTILRTGPDTQWIPPIRLSLILATLIISVVAPMQGAPASLSVPLFAIGVAALALFLTSETARRRQARRNALELMRRRSQIESLSDRMWELQESEERFRGLLDALGDVVVHRDRDGRIVYANAVLADLVGCDRHALTGRRLIDLGIDVSLVPDAAFVDGECLTSTDVAIETATGTRWFSWIEHSTRDKTSAAVSHRAIARDITQRKQAESDLIASRERAEHASQAKSRFLATVSHEIRTPMNGIIGMAKLLADTGLSPEQETYVGAVSTSAGHLLALIEDLLDYSKIEAGRFDIETQAVSPRELVENVVELLAARAFGKGIGLAARFRPTVPDLIDTDPSRLRQVLINLVGNAVKFTDHGGVIVSVDVNPDNASLRFSVRDTGPGLSEADMERIFGEFEQADTTTTRKHGGAGLGLAISRRIIQAMGGEIMVEAKPGAGAEFTIVLPIGTAATPKVRDNALAAARAVILARSAIEAEALASMIRDHGGSADIITEESAVADHPDANLVLIDAQIETFDGSRVQAIHAAGLRMAKAITLIAPADRGQLGQLYASGYSNFLARPVRGETLLRVLQSALNATTQEDRPAVIKVQAPDQPKEALNVLIAEDNEINALLARTALVRAGHSVEVVVNGRLAVERVTEPKGRRAVDLVLMDLHMPVMDGLDAIGLIRKHEDAKGLSPLPIIVLSADGQERTRHGVLAHGASGFVTKPLDLVDLVRAVEEQA